MAEDGQIEESEKAEDSELPKKKGLQALLGNKKILIGLIAVIVIVIAAGGMFFFKHKKKSVKETKKNPEQEKPVEKTAADFFDHVAVIGPLEIELTDSGNGPDVQEKAPSGNSEVKSGGSENKEADSHSTVSGSSQKEEGEEEEVEVMTLRIYIALELNNPKLSREIKAKSSMIENDITEMIKDKKIDELTSEEGKILLKNQLIANMNKMLESGKVRDIDFMTYLII